MYRQILKKIFWAIPLRTQTKFSIRRFILYDLKYIYRKIFFFKTVVYSSQIMLDDTENEFSRLKIKFEVKKDPTVTIIIPVHNQIRFTINLLLSIVKFKQKTDFEIIVINDASNDKTQSILKNISGLRLINNKTNLGFLLSCNKAAKYAKGKYIYFLNNDTMMVDNFWLDSLLMLINTNASVGAVGSKLIYSNNLLQEAGGLIWQDGSAWNYGRLKNPDHPLFNFVREVDYCSAASLLVRKDLFNKFGGFDKQFTPAYCEDSDFCLTLKKNNYKVLYQPLSQVVHYEGVSCGKVPVKNNIKTYQEINQKKFYNKWKSYLSSFPANDKNSEHNHLRGTNSKILIIDSIIPMPDRDAGSHTIFNLIKMLLSMRFSVTFIADSNFEYHPKYTQSLQQMGAHVEYFPFIHNINRYIKKNIAQYDVALLSRPLIFLSYYRLIKQYNKNIKIIYEAADIHSLRLKREAEVYQKTLSSEFTQTNHAEILAFKHSDLVILRSKYELQYAMENFQSKKIIYLPIVMEFGPLIKNGFNKREGIAFIGNYLHRPNIDAIHFFFEKIYSKIAKVQKIPIYIVGHSLPSNIKMKLKQYKNVNCLGHIEDLNLFLSKIRLTIAPLRYGAGIKGKVAYSMANKVPVIGTSVAFEGFPKELNQVKFDDPTSFSQAVIRLYNNPRIWNKVSSELYAVSTQLFEYEHILKSLKKEFKYLGVKIS
jgi:GT2 family glycosyltransferase/glycosyltransferase involved in cell wall biosynthesis